MTISTLLFFILGIALISYGANILVSSTQNISEKYDISYFISSFIFIGLATSSPEIIISILSSLDGKSNIAIGNALGSNIANVALVFALSYLFLTRSDLPLNKKIDQETYGFILFLIIISLLMIPLLNDGIFTSTESIVLITAFIVLMTLYKKFYYLHDSSNKKTISNNHQSGFMIALATIIGFALLLIGTEIFLANSISIAKYFGVTDYVIGLSITAVGTSIPELASSIESARKKNIDFIIGNILGSNIFNFTIVISAAGLISLAQEPLLMSDLIRDMIMILITLICFYIIIKNYNYMSTKFLCISLLVLFVIYQISLYEINI